jgi:Rhodanese-related sulfurtransferase
MAFTTLISTAALGLHVGDPAFVIVDCRFRLDDESWGEREYMNLHIPGAEYAHLGRDLSGPKTGTNGRHPLPDPKTFANTLSKFGITSGVQVVAYDQDNGMYAAVSGGCCAGSGTTRPRCLMVDSRSGSRKAGPPRLASRRASESDS